MKERVFDAPRPRQGTAPVSGAWSVALPCPSARWPPPAVGAAGTARTVYEKTCNLTLIGGTLM